MSGWEGIFGFARFGVLIGFVVRLGGVSSIANALSDAIGRVLQGKRVKDFCLDMDVSEGRVKVTIACSEQSFTLSAAQVGDEVRFVAAVAKNVGLTGACRAYRCDGG